MAVDGRNSTAEIHKRWEWETFKSRAEGVRELIDDRKTEEDRAKGGVDDATSESRPQASPRLGSFAASPFVDPSIVSLTFLRLSTIPGSVLSHTEFSDLPSGAGARYCLVRRLQWRQICPFLFLRALPRRRSMTFLAPPTMAPIQGLSTRTRCRH